MYDQVLHTFVAESRELLDEMERALLDMEADTASDDAINAVFRAAHTIKGSAGLFGLDHVVAFTHVAESVLDRARDGKVTLDPALITVLLGCRDHLYALIDVVDGGTAEPDPQLEAAAVPLLEALRAYLDNPASAHLPAVSAGPSTASTADPGAAPGAQHWHLSLRFGPEVLRNGMDPLAFLHYLSRLGRIVNLVTVPDALPASFDDFDPEQCYLGFELGFDSTADQATIEGVFEFVRDDAQIRILSPSSHVDEYLALIHSLPEDTTRLGDILVACGSTTEADMRAALRQQANAEDPVPPLGKILIEQGVVAPTVVAAALAKQKQNNEAKAQQDRSVRVDADRLDQLITLIGELTIAGAGANLLAQRTEHAELQEKTAHMAQLVQQVRDSALQLRMVKIGATFNRFQRVVHDVSREIGKDIQLIVSGEDTELDKTVVEKIADPLTHMVRNAIDHGIEAAAERVANGKPARGTLRLNAFHDSGSIVIEVSDDGGGLKRDRILAKAIERGLVETGRSLSEREICNLVFEPGFSTAEAVTNLSGRGVGMDVVKRNIAALRGTIELASEEGIGTKATVRLPLTLAIIDGFMVSLGQSVFVIPLDMIEECLEFSSVPGQDYTNLRGEVLPLLRLRDVFAVAGQPTRRESIVVVRSGGRRAGLVVDGLLGEFQTVIKPLGKVFQNIKCLSGSSILGTGEVALILDIGALFARIDQDRFHPLAA